MPQGQGDAYTAAGAGLILPRTSGAQGGLVMRAPYCERNSLAHACPLKSSGRLLGRLCALTGAMRRVGVFVVMEAANAVDGQPLVLNAVLRYCSTKNCSRSSIAEEETAHAHGLACNHARPHVVAVSLQV